MRERLVVVGIAGLAVVAACSREPEAPPPGWPAPGQFVPPPPAPPPPHPPGMPVPGGAQPAMGLPCSTDNDLGCPFGHCIGGRCGGCASGADCKPGSGCAWTFIGMACVPGAASGPPAPPPGGASGDPFTAARQACVDQTNQLRARSSLPPLARNPGAEPCLDQEARADAASGAAHSAFGRCGESAQNECPAWPGTPDAVVGPCFAQMYAEGPGSFPEHGHFANMTSRNASRVACGFATDARGATWVVQDFY